MNTLHRIASVQTSSKQWNIIAMGCQIKTRRQQREFQSLHYFTDGLSFRADQKNHISLPEILSANFYIPATLINKLNSKRHSIAYSGVAYPHGTPELTLVRIPPASVVNVVLCVLCLSFVQSVGHGLVTTISFCSFGILEILLID